MYNTNSKEKYEFLQKKQKNWIFSFSRENIFQKLFFWEDWKINGYLYGDLGH